MFFVNFDKFDFVLVDVFVVLFVECGEWIFWLCVLIFFDIEIVGSKVDIGIGFLVIDVWFWCRNIEFVWYSVVDFFEIEKVSWG